MLYFLVFILGALTHKLFSIVLSSNESFQIFKYSEVYSVSLLLETEVWRKQALQILQIVYDGADKEAEYNKSYEIINNRFDNLQQIIIKLIKERVPYSIQYSTLKEAEKTIKQELLKFQGESNEQQ